MSELLPLAERVLAWYADQARDLPWRSTPTPYRIWVSEIMLQQTRVENVIPYFTRWMERFPNIKALAAAPLQDVLINWEGLGYYSRARNLHRAAQILVAEYKAELPQEKDALQRLPGIGRYSAGAIASIAFGKDEPALDGNIRRVLARVFDVTEPARSALGERRLWQLAAENLPPGMAGDYNQALMDLGSQVCTPRRPACQQCPLASLCLAFNQGLQEERPVKRPRRKLQEYLVTAVVLQRDGQLLIVQRPFDGLLGGMWEFPGGKVEEGEDLISCLKREILEELGVEIRVAGALGKYRHAYTHFKVQLFAFAGRLTNGIEPQRLQVLDLQWVKPDELAQYPMGKIDRQIAHRVARCWELEKDQLWDVPEYAIPESYRIEGCEQIDGS